MSYDYWKCKKELDALKENLKKMAEVSAKIGSVEVDIEWVAIRLNNVRHIMRTRIEAEPPIKALLGEIVLDDIDSELVDAEKHATKAIRLVADIHRTLVYLLLVT